MKWLAIAALVIGCSSKASEDKLVPAGSGTGSTPAPSAPLRVGVTLHPYFSWASNVARGTSIEVVAVLPGDVDAGNYQPSPDDIAKLAKLDALVVNGIGHDDFIKSMITASGNTKLVLIEANAETPLLPSAHGEGSKNSHTFISFTNAIQQSRLIATKLGELRPGEAARLKANASAYADKLRAIQAEGAKKLANAKIKRVVTVHDGYSYLLQEFAIELAGVVQPAHGLVPSAKELGDMIALMKKEKVTVVFTEEDFPEQLLATLRDATHAKVHVISHVATGPYTPEKFEAEMKSNALALSAALVAP